MYKKLENNCLAKKSAHLCLSGTVLTLDELIVVK